MVIVLSLGEAIWSPRTYDYTMSIAPEGKEASFAALATAPLFLATVPVGLMSGFLVSAFLPEDGRPQQPRMLWLVVGLTTMISPVLITLLERWIREPVRAPAASSQSPVYSAAESDSINDRQDQSSPAATMKNNSGISSESRSHHMEVMEMEMEQGHEKSIFSSYRPLSSADNDRVPLVKKNGYTQCAAIDADNV